jgi:hypothetical protein
VITSEILPLTSDGLYGEVVEKKNYDSFVPYFITTNNVKVYYNNRAYMSFVEGTGVQSVEENVQVNAVTVEEKINTVATKMR